MSGYYNRNNRGITKKLGPVTAYADAVLAGYTGTREQWAQDMAKLGQNVTQVAQNTKLTTELAVQTRVNTEQVAKDTADVRELAEETSDNAAQVASNTAESSRLAEETKQAAAQAKEDAEYAGAAADNFRVDATLSEAGKAAEAKTTGEKFAQLSEAITNENKRAVARENEIEELFTLPTQEAVNKWLDEHPEVTTTVQDNSLTIDKMVVGTLGYVTPEMFGAKGDGVTDDTEAVLKALEFANNKMPVIFDSKHYYFKNGLDIVNQNNVLIGTSNGTNDIDGATNGTLFTSGNKEYVVNISEYNNRLENIAVNGSKIGFFIKCVRNGAEHIMYGIQMKNCHTFDNSEAGFEIFQIVNSKFENCVATKTPIGFYMPVNGQNSTMVEFTHCWARDVSYSGFLFNQVYYSSLKNCGCDISTVYAYVLQNCSSFSIESCGGEYVGTLMRTTDCNGVSVRGAFCAFGNKDGTRPASILINENSTNVTIDGINKYQCGGAYAISSDNEGVYVLSDEPTNSKPNMKDIISFVKGFKDVVVVPMVDATQSYFTPTTHDYYIGLLVMFTVSDGKFSDAYTLRYSAGEKIIEPDNTRNGFCILMPIDAWLL